MVMIAPQIATTNPAPALRRTSRTGTLNPVGAPRRDHDAVDALGDQRLDMLLLAFGIEPVLR